jgi:hypothetical protein
MDAVEHRGRNDKCTVGIVSCRTDVIPFFLKRGYKESFHYFCSDSLPNAFSACVNRTLLSIKETRSCSISFQQLAVNARRKRMWQLRFFLQWLSLLFCFLRHFDLNLSKKFVRPFFHASLCTRPLMPCLQKQLSQI